MGKIFKKVVCLLLGAILGLTSILATVVTAGYYMYSELPVGNIVAPGKAEDLGEVGEFSLEDLIDLLQQGSTAPESYTIADLKEKYGLDVIGLINGLGGDKPLIDENDKQFIADLESVSLFTLFSDEGMARFLADLPMGAVLGFISEDTFLAKAERDKLRSYSVGQLFAKDEITGKLGILSALGEIKVGGVLPSLFEDLGNGKYTTREGAPDFLELIANVEFGAFINVILGETTVGDEFVEGGLSSVGNMTVGDLLGAVLGEDNELASKLDNLFNGIQFKDLFEKDVATGSYKFVIDKLLDNVKLGAILGYEKDENGNWFEKDADGNLVPVGGLMSELASLDLTTLYHVLTSDAPTSEKIHNALLVLGDVTVGDIFELLGYKCEEGVWLDKSGEPVSKFLESIFSISIEDIIGEQGSDFTLKNIRKNLTAILSERCGDLTLGEAIGGLLGVELDVESGKFIYKDGEKQGQKVNSFMQSLLDIKVSDIVDCFSGETVEIDNLVTVLEGALAGSTVGDLLGAERENGKWFKDGAEVGTLAGILYDMNFAGIFAMLKQLGTDSFSYASIIEGLLPDLAVGDLASLLLKNLTAEDKDWGTEYSLPGGPVEKGLNVILNLKLWQVIAGLDANHPYDLKDVIKDIPLGEAINFVKQEYDGWKISDERIAYGALAEMFDLTLGQLLSDEEGETKELVKEILNKVAIGDVLSLALGYDRNANRFPSTADGEIPNGVVVALCKWDFTIGDIMSIVKGETAVDSAFLREELNGLLGDVAFGETFRGLLTDFAEGSNELTVTVLPILSGILDPVFNAKYSVYINLICDILDGKELDAIQLLRDIYGNATLGDFIAPIIGAEKNSDGIYFVGETSLGKGVTDLLDSVVVDVMEVFVKGDGEFKDKLSRLFNEKIVNVDNRLGDFLTALGIEEKDGKFVEYEPLNKILSVNVLEILNVLLLDGSKTSEEKRDYLVDIFEGLTLGQALPFLPEDKLLLKKVGDVRIDLVIHDIFDKEKKILDVIKAHLGSIALGDLANLFMGVTPDGEIWKNGDKELPIILSNVFNIDVEDILGWVEAKFDKQTISSVVLAINGEYSVLDHVNDITNKDGLGNKGLDKLLGLIKLNELADVMLGLKTDITNKMMDDPKIAYILNITDQVFFGDFLGLESSEDNKQWYNKDGSEVKGVMNTVYGIPLSYVLYLIAAIMDPSIALDLIKDVRIGDLIQKTYNDIGAIDSTIVGDPEDKETPYVVEGAFKFFMEDVANLTFGDMHESALGRKTAVQDLKRFMLDRPLGDYLFDLLVQFVFKDGKGGALGLVGYGSKVFKDDEYKVTANLAEVMNVVLNLNVAKILEADNKIDYLKGEIDHLLIGDLLYDVTRAFLGDKFQLAFVGKFAHEAKTAGNGKYILKANLKDVLEPLFNINIVELLNSDNKVDFVKDVYKDLLVGDLLFEVLRKLINKKANLGLNSFAYVNKEDNGGKYLVEKNFAELVNATFNIRVMDLLGGNVGTLLKDTYAGIELGDLLYDVARKVLGNENRFGISGPAIKHASANNGYKLDNSLLNAVFNINVIDLLTSGDMVQYLKDTLAEVYVGDIIGIAIDIKHVEENWLVKGKDARKVLKQIFDVQIKDILTWVKDGNLKEMIRGILGDLTFNELLIDDLGLEIFKKEIFSSLGKEKIADFIIYIIDKDFGKIKDIAGAIRLGDVVNLAVSAISRGDSVWENNGKALPIILSNVFDITVSDILNWVESKFSKETISIIVYKVNGENSVLDHVNDITNKDGLGNKGLDKLLGLIKLNEFADVMLGLKTDITNKMMDDPKIAYILNITDQVFFGDFLGLESSEDNKQWYNKDGSEVKGVMNTVYGIPLSYVLYLIAAIMDPSMALDLINDVRIGDLIQKTYNNIGAIDSTIVGDPEDKETPYVVEGAFKFFMEDVANLTFGDMHESALGRKTAVKDLKRFMLDRPLGDYLFDLLVQFVFKDGKGLVVGLVGYGSNVFKDDEYKVTANLAEVMNVVLNLNMAKILEADSKIDYLKGEIDHLLIGDLLYDVTRAFLGDKLQLGIVGKFAHEAKTAGNGKYILKANLKDVLEPLFNINIVELLNSDNKVDFVKDVYKDLLVGDLLFEVLRKLINKKASLGLNSFAYVNKENNGGKYLVKLNFADILNATFNIKVFDLIEAPNKVAFIKDVYKDLLIGDFIYDLTRKFINGKANLGVVGKAYKNKTDNGGKYVLNKNFADVLMTTFNIKVFDLIDATNKVEFIKETYKDLMVGDLVFDVTRKFLNSKANLGIDDSAINNKTENGGKYLVKKNFAEFITITLNIKIFDVLNANDKVQFVKDTFATIEVGDLLYDVARKILGINNRFGINDSAYNHVLDNQKFALKNALISVIFNINIVELLNAGDKVEFIKNKFVEIAIVDLVGLVKDTSRVVRSTGYEVWAIGNKALPLIASVVLDVTVEEIFNILDSSDKVNDAVKAVFDDSQIGDYIADLKLTVVTDNAAFDKLCKEKVATFVSKLLTAENKLTFVLSYFDEARVGDIAKLALKNLSREEDKWYNGEKGMKLIISDVFDVTVGDVRGWTKTIKEKQTISNIAHAIAKERTVLVYVTDFLGKESIGNKGADKLLGLIVISEAVDVVLGFKTDATHSMMNDPKIAYVLNITDQVFFGDFAGLESSEDNKQWYNKNGSEVKGLMNTVYGMPVSYVLYAVAVIVKPELILDVVGDKYIGTFIKDTYNKLKIDSTIVGDNNDGYVVQGAFKELVEDIANVKVKTIYDDVKNKTIKNKAIDLFIDREVGDILYDVLVQFVYKKDKFKLSIDGYAYDKVVDGKYVLDRNFKFVLEEVLNLNIKTTIKDYKAGSKQWMDDFLAKFLVGDVAFDLLRMVINKKIHFCLDGQYGYQSYADGKYSLAINFKDVFEPLFNTSLSAILKAKNKVDFFLNEVYSDLLIGDILYDVMREVSEKVKVNIGLAGAYAYKNKEINNGKYFADQNFSAIISKTFNLGVKELYDAYKGKTIKAIIHYTYKDVTLGDLGYDLFRKFMAKKMTLKAKGYAWQLPEHPELIQGKLAKVARATFAVTLDDIFQWYRKRVSNTDLLVGAYGHLSLGDVVAPFVEKMAEKNLKCTFNYDVENDYAVTVSGNFAEIFNVVFGVNMERVIRTKKPMTLFFGEDGILEDMPAGHVVGYLAKTKALSKTFKKTSIQHEYDGEWIIGGTYAVPMDILCNDVTLGTIYASRKSIKSKLIIPYFGKVELGHFAGGTLIGGAWYKPNGEIHPTHGAKNVIMISFYNTTVEEILAKDFDPTTVIEDIYAGQIMSYYRCGDVKYTVDEEGDYPLCLDEACADDKGAYHLHEGDETKYTVVKDGEFTYCEDATHVDDKFAYHTHFECDFEGEHDHANYGEGWYYKENGKYKKAGAVESAVANLTLKTLMAGRFSMAETLRGVKLGEAMNLVHCDESGVDCPVTELYPAHVCEEGWYEKKTEGDVVTYKKVSLVLEKIADIDLYNLFTNGLDLEETFSGTYVGDVLGYHHCYIDGEGNRVCSEELGHGDGDHKTNNMWYIHTDSDDDGVLDSYRKATPLERTMASVGMSKILNGEFDVEKELEDITLGEFMSYEKCTHDSDCFVHPDGTHVADVVWYHEEDDGSYTVVTDNLVLAIADFTIKQMQDPTFPDQLLTNVKDQVTLGDIFGDPEDIEGTPLSLIDSNTKIGDINSALETVFETATAGEMYRANVLPFGDSTFEQMDSKFGALIMIDKQSVTPGDTFDRIDSSYDPYINAALDAHAEDACNPGDAGYEEYVNAVGETFWMSLTANQLVDVLVSALEI